MIHAEYKIGDEFLFDSKRNTLTSLDENAESTILGTNESRLLVYLIHNRTRTVSRKELIDALWSEREIYVDDSSLTQSISILRKALNDSYKEPNYIKTVPKQGYELVADVYTEANEAILCSGGEHCVNEGEQLLLTDGESSFGLLKPHLLVLNSLLLRFEAFLLMVALLVGLYSFA